jgi:hypothetical protein
MRITAAWVSMRTTRVGVDDAKLLAKIAYLSSCARCQ